jgi:hypothetical protein
LCAPAGVYFSGDHTVAVWLTVTSFSAWTRIIDFGNGPAVDNLFISISNSLTNSPTTAMYNFVSLNPFLTSNTTLQANAWTHLVHTYSAGVCRIYLNALLTAQGPCVAPRNINRPFCYVGKSNWVADPFLNGQLDELSLCADWFYNLLTFESTSFPFLIISINAFAFGLSFAFFCKHL